MYSKRISEAILQNQNKEAYTQAKGTEKYEKGIEKIEGTTQASQDQKE